MEAYWSQYRTHCLEQAAKSAATLESLHHQQAVLIEHHGNPVWIASLGREIAEAQHAMEAYQTVIATLDGNGQLTG